MNIVAIVGSYRKQHTMDTLVDWALEGAAAGHTDARIERIFLLDQHIEYCRNCARCKQDDYSKPIADCVIEDDMRVILPKLVEADALIFGTPVNMGTATAVLKTFLERACWPLARPGRFPLAGCPKPRTFKPRKAVIIVSSGTVPPWLRRLCDDATPLLKSFCNSILGAKVVGSMYAGATHTRGVECYHDRAVRLGRRLR